MQGAENQHFLPLLYTIYISVENLCGAGQAEKYIKYKK